MSRFSHTPVFRPTHAEIDLEALRHNGLWLQKLAPHFFCPMVKSNAYGHGDVDVVKSLTEVGIETYGIALLEEALRLRTSNCKTQTLLMFGCFGKREAQYLHEHKITPVVKLWEEFEALEHAVPKTSAIPIHIKFDTGMARMGFSVAEAEKLQEFLLKNPRFELLGVCSHLLQGEDMAVPMGMSFTQSQKLKELVSFFGPGPEYHLYNSSGALSLWAHHREDEIDLGFRPGIALYGVAPDMKFAHQQAQEKWKTLPLKPVMRLRTEVVSVRTVKKGDTVSYGGRWTAKQDSQVAVIPIGYADGYSRKFSNCGQVLFRGQRVPVVGTVCMDYTLIDLTAASESGISPLGEEVLLLGSQGSEHLDANEVASWSETISYELLSCVGRRVPRKYN
ncbi:MAG: alanine racemase [Bdellovibrionales bacterium]|nr:alanine racemase [Bdellovibrionales bacterium]